MTSGAGTFGTKLLRPRSSTSIATASINVGIDVLGKLWNSATRFSRNVPFVKCTPSSFGTWSSTITTPMPALKPDSTGSEMKLARKPSRSTDASASMMPTISASVAAAVNSMAGSPFGTTTASSAPVKIAIVVVVVTLSTREVPSTA